MKPMPPHFPEAAVHPQTPDNQKRPMLEAYHRDVQAFYDSLKLYTLDGFEHWGTPALPSNISDADLELELAKLSPQARAALVKKS